MFGIINCVMGILEKQVSQKNKRDRLVRVILKTVAAAGFLSVALIAPNAFQIIKIFDKGKRAQNQKNYLKTVTARLVKQGLIEFRQTDHGTFLRITSQGEKKLRQIELRNFHIQKPKKWDGKWRVVIFDIKETKRDVRDKLRLSLVHLGFVRLQHSVWVSPYDCEDFVTLLKADFMIGKDILYLIVEKLENDAALRAHYEL